MSRNIGKDRVLRMLELAIIVAGSQKALGKEIGVSDQYICDILRGRREPAGKVLKWLGLERVVTYRRTDGGTL